jgi:hypothetical protein
MFHATSLRVIGQTLEGAQVPRFKLVNSDSYYRLWIAKDLFCFDEAEISRLDAQARNRRANHLNLSVQQGTLSQQLRALGDYLDRLRVCHFRLVWTGNCAILDYKRFDSDRNSRVFTADELRQLGLNRSLLRSTAYLSHSLHPSPITAED